MPMPARLSFSFAEARAAQPQHDARHDHEGGGGKQWSPRRNWRRVSRVVLLVSLVCINDEKLFQK